MTHDKTVKYMYESQILMPILELQRQGQLYKMFVMMLVTKLIITLDLRLK